MSEAEGYIERRWRTLWSVLSVRPFRLFSIGNFMSLTAIWIVRVCVAWTTWELTGSKTWLGLMAFAELGPSVLISIYAGPLADRMDRFTILKFGQNLQTLLALALVALVFLNLVTVWWMLAIMLGFSIVGGLTLPARLSMAPSLVPSDQLSTASAIGSITLNVTRFIGPLVAAPLLAASIDWVAFLLSALGFAINALCLSSVRPEDRLVAAAPHTDRHSVKGYGEVFRQIRTDRALAVVLLMQLALWLLAPPLTQMLPAFAVQVFQQTEAGFAALNIAVGIGALVGALAVMGESADSGMRLHLFGGSVLLCATMIGFAQTDTFWLALAVLCLFGAAMTSTAVAATTFVQVRTPKSRLGRVMSLYSVIFRLAPAVGAVVLGLLADIIGLRMATMALPIAGLAILLVLWPAFNAGRRAA